MNLWPMLLALVFIVVWALLVATGVGGLAWLFFAAAVVSVVAAFMSPGPADIPRAGSPRAMGANGRTRRALRSWRNAQR